MRELHDSILVGIGTLLNDDPQLNGEFASSLISLQAISSQNLVQLAARIPSLLPVSSQPTPIILDRHLRTPLDCKLLKNAQAGIGKAPVIVTCGVNPSFLHEHARREKALEAAGATVIQVDITRRELPDFPAQIVGLKFSTFTVDVAAGGFTLASLVDSKALRPHLGRSLMIEGGSSIISSFLSAPEVDMIVTTVAPTFVGEDGVGLLKPGVSPNSDLSSRELS